MYGECFYRQCVILQRRMQKLIRVFVALIVIFFVLSKFILIVDNVNPLLLFCANISLQIFQDFVIIVTVIRVAIIWS